MVANTHDLPLRSKEASEPTTQKSDGVVEYGKGLLQEQFLFDPKYRNLNHG